MFEINPLYILIGVVAYIVIGFILAFVVAYCTEDEDIEGVAIFWPLFLLISLIAGFCWLVDTLPKKLAMKAIKNSVEKQTESEDE